MLRYPNIDPIALSLGPLHIHWYGVMYLVGFAGAWWLARRRASRPGSSWTAPDVDDFLFYAMLGVILGGRIGYVLFYGMPLWRGDWLYPLKIWEGGMSFHGGMLGVLAAAWINGELWGRPTDVPWAMLVPDPNGGAPIARHPSQLYEATLEGLVLFSIMWWFTSTPRPRYAPSGLFLICYSIARILVEFVREPDVGIGYLAFGWLTMGQLLSLPMLLLGIWLWSMAYRQRIPSGNFVAVQ
jgi:phosphatidylglycerol:prolipoprotein diacylglycerol transferase